MVVFGGADREQCHFQDLIVYQKSPSSSGSHSPPIFEAVKSHGDIPMPRSGHSMVSYGRFVFLFGGIDFAEEVAYNDLYILDSGE